MARIFGRAACRGAGRACPRPRRGAARTAAVAREQEPREAAVQPRPVVDGQEQQPRCADPVRVEAGRPAGPVRVGDSRDRVAAGVVRGELQVVDADHAVDVDEPVEDVRHPQLGPQVGVAEALLGEEPVVQLGPVEDRLDRLAAGEQLVERPELDRWVEVPLDLVPDPSLDEVDVGAGLDLDVGADRDLVDLDQVDVAVVLVEVAVRLEHGLGGVDGRVGGGQLPRYGSTKPSGVASPSHRAARRPSPGGAPCRRRTAAPRRSRWRSSCCPPA